MTVIITLAILVAAIAIFGALASRGQPVAKEAKPVGLIQDLSAFKVEAVQRLEALEGKAVQDVDAAIATATADIRSAIAAFEQRFVKIEQALGLDQTTA